VPAGRFAPFAGHVDAGFGLLHVALDFMPAQLWQGRKLLLQQITPETNPLLEAPFRVSPQPVLFPTYEGENPCHA